ncbi:MAG TPA: glycosyltransferase family 2 protein, partial [Gemmataceae bacterium]|nr:glycosyltransferase family 2 protein [Gemmataceae bacterium]
MPPLVSVCVVTYNHEKYIVEAVESVLAQTFRDLEVVIVNDGSTDGTASRIASLSDPRIVAVHQENQGPSAATNRALAACRGKYVALFSGDDVCHPHRIERQLQEYNRGGRAVLFAGCDFVGEDGEQLADRHFAATVFDDQHRSRAANLRRLFYHGNYFNGVTVFTEREILASRPYDPGLLQLQDYDVWVRLLRDFDLRIMPERLVKYRVRGGGGNLSSPNRERILRIKNEYYLILRRFFDGVSSGLFREAFAEELVRPDFSDGPEFACEQAFAFCRSEMPFAKLIGIERLHALLADSATAAALAGRYNFSNASFFRLLGTLNVTDLFDGGYSTLFPDYGGGWDTTARVCQRVSPTIERFEVRFELSPGRQPSALRWDPMELQTCRVLIDAIELRDSAGRVQAVDPATIESNGDRMPDGTVSFRTADPMFSWPVTGEVSEVVVRGRWETDEALQTILAQSRHVAELTQQLTEVRREVRALSGYRRLSAPLRAVKA